ncbi:ClpXP protease specificity-enhancing factor [Roseateles sp. DC23W]|uniref:ClpXP protease specificity-enhancing factor n=1 Tax=Pelomonas dachongensis TaxID=3299029 RepID=A0ABW7ES91_9BURK
MDQTPAPGGAGNGTSTRPYLIRALHDWCTDNGFTPYIAVHVDRSVQVPMEYVSNNEIVLNVGFDATSGLDLGNEFIQFKARFGGVAREIVVPVDHVVAIYARENGQGMAFPAPEPLVEGAAPPQPAPVAAEPRRSGLRLASETGDDEGDDTPPSPDAPSGAPRPALKRVK